MKTKFIILFFSVLSLIAKSQDFTSVELNKFLESGKLTRMNDLKVYSKFLNLQLDNYNEIEFEIIKKVEIKENIVLVQFDFLGDYNNGYCGITLLDKKNNQIISNKVFATKSIGASDGGTTYWESEVIINFPLVVVNITTKWKNSLDCNLLDFYNERSHTEIFYIGKDYSFNLKYKSEFVENEYYLENDLAKLSKCNKEELRKYRNYFFAKHNYKFKSSDLREYFESNMRNYNSVNENVDSLLSHWDKYMINYIKLLESQK